MVGAIHELPLLIFTKGKKLTEAPFGAMRPSTKPRKNILLGARSVSLTKTNSHTIVENIAKPMIQIYWCVEGEVFFHYKNEEIKLTPQCTFAYPYMYPHKLVTKDKPVFFYYWTVDGDMAPFVLENNIKYTPTITNAGEVPLAKLKELETYILDLSFAAEIKASALAYELILLAMTPLQQKEIHASLLVQNCVNFLSENYTSPLTTIGQAAKKLNVSRNHLSRQFHQEQGVPPTEYLTHLRIQKGIQLLKSTQLKIHEIATQCGFEDPNYFARVIRKRIKESPTLYRLSER